MDADAVQVEWALLHLRDTKSSLDIFLLFDDLVLHLLNLRGQFIEHTSHKGNGATSCLFLIGIQLLLQRMMAVLSSGSFRENLLVVLFNEEIRHKFEHIQDIFVGPAKVLILIYRLL